MSTGYLPAGRVTPSPSLSRAGSAGESKLLVRSRAGMPCGVLHDTTPITLHVTATRQFLELLHNTSCGTVPPDLGEDGGWDMPACSLLCLCFCWQSWPKTPGNSRLVGGGVQIKWNSPWFLVCELLRLALATMCRAEGVRKAAAVQCLNQGRVYWSPPLRRRGPRWRPSRRPPRSTPPLSTIASPPASRVRAPGFLTLASSTHPIVGCKMPLKAASGFPIKASSGHCLHECLIVLTACRSQQLRCALQTNRQLFFLP